MATMNPASPPGVPYTVPPEPSRLPSVLLAVAMHVVLLAFLYIGVNWQNTEPVTVEAEVWDMRVQDAAPAPAPEPPPPPPEPAPKPDPAPPPPRPEPVKQVEPPPAKPDIALERKKQKELDEKLQKEKQLKEERLAEEKRKKEELRKKEQEKKLAEKKEQDKKLAEEKKQKELAEKKEKEKEKEKAEKVAKAKAAEEQKRLDKQRAEQIARITGAAGSGSAAQSTAPRVDEGYKLAIQTKIKNNTTYLGSPENNPRVEFRVEQLPTGEIVSVRMTRSSGIPAFDEAVEKGIMKASPLPKKKDGTVERTVTVGYRPRDLD